MTEVPTIGNAAFAQMLAKTRDAVASGGPGALSTGEALAAALILNRPDWLAEMNYTIAEALARIGPDWAQLIPAAAKQFRKEIEDAARNAAAKARQAQLDQFTAQQQADDTTIECSARFVTHGSAPGYRDVYLTFDLQPIEDAPRSVMRTHIRVHPDDAESIVRAITEVHRFAWRNGKPIDLKENEQRPQWIDR